MKRIILVALASVPGFAFADLPTSATTAISGAGTDTITALGLIIGVVVGIWALKKVAALFGR